MHAAIDAGLNEPDLSGPNPAPKGKAEAEHARGIVSIPRHASDAEKAELMSACQRLAREVC